MELSTIGIAFMISAAAALGACGHAGVAGDGRAGCSRYQVGDYVVYRTTQLREGREETIHLLERVDEKRCRKLVIHDWQVRGDRVVEWKMHLTDTPHNQKNNIADALYVKGKAGWRQAPVGELRRLFATGVDVDGQTKLVGVTVETCRVGGRSHACQVKRTEGTVGGAPVRVVCRRSDAFLWTNIGCTFTRKGDGKTILAMEVVDVGRVQPGELPASWRRLLRRQDDTLPGDETRGP